MADMKQSAASPIRFDAVAPQFTVPDVVRTAEYYRDVLGFHLAGYWDGKGVSFATDPPPGFAILRRDKVEVFLRADASGVLTRAPGAYDAYFHVIGVEALAADLRLRGADIQEGPDDRVYQQRELVVKDCNGRLLAFAEDTSGR